MRALCPYLMGRRVFCLPSFAVLLAPPSMLLLSVLLTKPLCAAVPLMWCVLSGCGKTELCQRFKQAGFQILDEAFLDMPEYMLHPQSLLMETTWVCAWYDASEACGEVKLHC